MPDSPFVTRVWHNPLVTHVPPTAIVSAHSDEQSLNEANCAGVCASTLARRHYFLAVCVLRRLEHSKGEPRLELAPLDASR